MKNSKDSSLFVTSALALDADFSEMERLADQLESLSIESEYGFDQSCKLLTRFGSCGERIGNGIQILAKELETARVRAEASAARVAVILEQVQKRKQANDKLTERFQTLGEMVKTVNASVVNLTAKVDGTEKETLKTHLPTITAQLSVLMDEANRLKEDSKNANLKQMEKNAFALGQSLLSVKNKIATLAVA